MISLFSYKINTKIVFLSKFAQNFQYLKNRFKNSLCGDNKSVPEKKST